MRENTRKNIFKERQKKKKQKKIQLKKIIPLNVSLLALFPLFYCVLELNTIFS